MAMERAGDTEFRLDAHDSSLHLIETTGCCPTTARKPRRRCIDSDWGVRQGRVPDLQAGRSTYPQRAGSEFAAFRCTPLAVEAAADPLHAGLAVDDHVLPV